MEGSAVIYLASRSPRRRELLQQIGVDFDVIDVNVDEGRRPREQAADFVARLAMEKARAGRRLMPVDRPLPVLGADTIVIAAGEILGKPHDRDAALRMLQQLSGTTHRVLTAVALADATEACRVNSSSVTFRTLTERECAAYWASGEPADKAGGYAVQGLAAVFISRIEGSYSGIMGLPLYETAELLTTCGIDIV